MATGDDTGADKPRVLIVDDSRVIRKVISKTLRGDFDLAEAEDGETGWQMLTEDPLIQAVITDVEMPRLDGYGLLARIRRAPEAGLRPLPVIVITGADDEAARQHALDQGASDFITKPIDAVQLLARVHAHVKLGQTTRRLSQVTQALEEQAAVDPLTQLASAAVFHHTGAQDLAYARRHGDDLSLICLDVDGYDAIRERHGAGVGDRLLAWLAAILVDQSRTEDTVSRLGGGRFAILTPAAGRLEAAVLCERLRATIAAASFSADGLTLPITISLGLATLGRDPGETLEALLAVAEERLAQARAGGGNRLGAGEVPRPAPAPPSLDAALARLEGGDPAALDAGLPALLRRLLPLLEHADAALGLGLAGTLGMLRARLSRD